MNPKVQELLNMLIAKGMPQEEIIQVRDDLLASAFESFMNEALLVLTDEDLKTIEASPTQEDANAVLKRLYSEKSGKDSQEVMKAVVERKADELIAKYASDVIAANDQAELEKAQHELKTISDNTSSQSQAIDPEEAAKVSNWQ